MVIPLIMTIGAYASLLPLLLGLFTFTLNSKAIRYLILLSAVAGITEVTGTYLAYQQVSNLFLFHLYPPVEFSILLTIYSLNLKQYISAKVFWVVGILFAIISILNTLFIEPFTVFNANGRGLESFLVLGLAVGYSILLLYRPTEDRDRNRSMFWINTGLLIYFSVNLVFFSMNNFLLENFSAAFNTYLWVFHSLVSTSLYLFFTFAIYLDWKKAKSPDLS